MDELRQLSYFTAKESREEAFKKPSEHRKSSPEQLPRRPPPLPNLISIRDGEYFSDPVSVDSLGQLGTQEKKVDGSIGSPKLEMVVVSRTEGDTIELPHSTFEDLIRNFKIEAAMLQHVYMCSYGFYHYNDWSSPLAASYGSDTPSFFFGNFLFSVVWSFDRETEKTSAVLILRTIRRHFHGVLPLLALQKALKVYRNHLKSPLFLVFIFFNILTHVLEENLYRIVRKLRNIEADTNHGPSSKDSPTGHQNESYPTSGQVPVKKEEHRGEPIERQHTGLQKLAQNENHIDALTKVAKKLANVNVHLANLVRHTKLLKSMGETLADKSFRDVYCKPDVDGDPSRYREDTEFFVATLPSLRRRLEAIEPSIEYLQGRAKGQHQVVFGLLTHEDAMVNLRVARDNTSIASAARNDSSAMKTIALMTMIFLPGTFYAALFDQPTLNWEPTRPGVIQDGFAVYWALTVPSTLLVLLTSWVMHRGWALLGERGKTARKMWEGLTGKSKGKKQLDEESIDDSGSGNWSEV